MRAGIRMTLAVCFLCVGAAGCDQLPFLQPKGNKNVKAPAGGSVASVRGTVIARVNNLSITLEELNQEVEAYNSMVPEDRQDAKITTREQKINYVRNQMVRTLLLYQEALDRRLDESEETQRILERAKREYLAMEVRRKESESIDVTSQDVEEFYNTYKEGFKEVEERQIREIVVATESDAKELLIQLLQGGDFSAIARDRSLSESKKDGGNLGFLKPGQKFPQFDAVAFSDSLEQGSTSNIFKGPQGYYIIKFEGKRGGKQMAMSDVWDDIKKALTFKQQQQRIETLIGKLSQTAKIDILEAEIK